MRTETLAGTETAEQVAATYRQQRGVVVVDTLNEQERKTISVVTTFE
jgi:hypothetical protein